MENNDLAGFVEIFDDDYTVYESADYKVEGITLEYFMLIGIIYVQHDFVIRSYKEQTREDTISEQQLKRNMYEQQAVFREEMNQSLLKAENQLLEERASLSQTLHDKLGHNINGSIYQLEAIKLIMEKEPETARKMTQAVIDQLRTGMDEIRAILRKERPKKYKLAILQLQQLCDECKEKGVEAEHIIEGELSKVPEKYLEIILDNAFEAVSNSMKYSKCTKIEIKIYCLNQMVRCSISDNGVGCSEIEDGMGIAATRYIVENNLGKVLILTTFDDDELIQSALKNGAKGYLIKNHTPEHLKQMIKSVYYGTGVMEETILENLAKEDLSHRTALAVYYLTGKKPGI